MGTLPSTIMPLVFSILLGSLVCQLSGRPYGQSLPIGYLGTGLVLYLSTLVTGRFTVGYFLMLAVSLCSVALAWKRKAGKELDKILLTPGFFAFLLLYCFVFFAQTGRSFQWWDEISHWGPMVKEILRLDTLYSVPASSLGIHKDYPPFFPLLEAFWCRLSRGYAEENLYRCLLTVEFSFFLPMFETIRPGKRLLNAAKILGGCVLVVLGCSVICGDIPFFTSVYLDYPLALLLAYGLCLVVLEEKPTLFLAVGLAFTGSAILLTKQMGIAFYLMILGLLTAVFLWQLLTEKENRTALLKKQAVVWCSAALIPLILSKTWSLYTARLNLSGQFSLSDMKLSELPGIWFGTAGDEVQWMTFRYFVNAYEHKNIWAAGAGRMAFSYCHMTGLFALALVALTVLAWKSLKGSRLVLLDCVLLGGSVCYALVMLVTYLYGFSDYEALHLASFSRYMNTYWFAAAAVIIVLFFAAIQRFKPLPLLALLAAAVVLITGELFWEQRDNLNHLLPPRNTDSPTVYHSGDAGILLNNTPEDASVLVIDQHTDGFATHVLRYMVSPRTINDNYYSLGAPYEEGDVWTENLTAEEFAQILSGYDYLYFVYVDGQFIETYGDLLPDSPHAGGLYRVTDTAPLTLEQIYHN